MFFSHQRKTKAVVVGFMCAASLCATKSFAQTTLSSNSTGNQGGHYYSFWKDSGDATMTLYDGGRYGSQWSNSTNNWVGGKGWNPGGPRTVYYEGYYGVSNSQNSYLALYGWTRNPLIEYYVIESYGSYNPSSCSGGQNYGSLNSDGGSYSVRRCQRVNQPSIEGTATFYQYFSVRNSKKGFGQISGTITVSNHFNYWASQGLNLGNHDYMIMATEGYQSSGSSDISLSQTSGGGGGGSTGGGGGSDTDSSPSSTAIVVRARGTAGGEHINLNINGNTVASWNLTTTAANYSYSGSAGGDIQVEFDNDGGDRDVILDWVFVNGETRQAEDMDYNTATYGNGECGGGSNSETMHCNGVIGFGGTGNCFSGSCNNQAPSGSTGGGGTGGGGTGGGSTGGGSTGGGSTGGGSTGGGSTGGGSTGGSGITVRARGTAGGEHINLRVGGTVVASWNLTTSAANYTYSGSASGDIQVQFDNDGGDRDVILDYVQVNGETRQAEDMDYNTATYGNGECGGGSYSETMHCNGVIGFGETSDCFSGSCTSGGGSTGGGSTGGGSTGGGSTGGGTTGGNCSCNWWGTTYPLCSSTDNSWGWENNSSCIGSNVCNSQSGNGGVVCN